MYLEIFLGNFAVLHVFLGNSRDFAEIPEFRGSATARNIRSPDNSPVLSGRFSKSGFFAHTNAVLSLGQPPCTNRCLTFFVIVVNFFVYFSWITGHLEVLVTMIMMQ